MKNNRFLFANFFLVALVFTASQARADLIDDDAPVKKEETVPPPTKPPEAKPVNEGQTNESVQKLPKSEVKPASKNASGSPSSGVLAPKGQKDHKKKKNNDSEQPIHFESNGAKAIQKNGIMELQENVIVTQGTMRVEADSAKVFYDDAMKDVAKVIALGNIKMFKIDEDSGEKIQAMGDEAIFLNKERLVTMEGNARLWRGADLVRGKKITYEMDSGWIKADRITGEVHPNAQKSLSGPASPPEPNTPASSQPATEAHKPVSSLAPTTGESK